MEKEDLSKVPFGDLIRRRDACKYDAKTLQNGIINITNVASYLQIEKNKEPVFNSLPSIVNALVLLLESEQSEVIKLDTAILRHEMQTVMKHN